MPPQSKVEVRALKRVRTSTSPYILYVTSLQRVYSNRSLFYGFAVACTSSTTYGMIFKSLCLLARSQPPPFTREAHRFQNLSPPCKGRLAAVRGDVAQRQRGRAPVRRKRRSRRGDYTQSISTHYSSHPTKSVKPYKKWGAGGRFCGRTAVQNLPCGLLFWTKWCIMHNE